MEQIGSSSDEQPQQPMQGMPLQAVPGGARPAIASPPCSYRVSHSSGETICPDLASARLVLSRKPGAKIFLQRG